MTTKRQLRAQLEEQTEFKQSAWRAYYDECHAHYITKHGGRVFSVRVKSGTELDEVDAGPKWIYVPPQGHLEITALKAEIARLQAVLERSEVTTETKEK